MKEDQIKALFNNQVNLDRPQKLGKLKLKIPTILKIKVTN